MTFKGQIMKRYGYIHQNKQFLEARPWMMFLLSFGILNPTYYYDTVIEIPSTCPTVGSSNVEQNYYISERLK
jgi:arginine exporter protein ArgO